MVLELTLDEGFSVIELVGRTRVWVNKIGKCGNTWGWEVTTPCIHGTASWIARESVFSDETYVMNKVQAD